MPRAKNQKSPNRKLDIFKVLGHISQKDHEYFRSLTEEEQKGFFPLVVMRWLSGTSSARQIYYLNELVNPMVFSNYKHPELIYFLMTTCTSGKSQRYFWNKTASKKSSKTPTIISVICEYFGYNKTQACEALPLLSNDDILSYVEQLGLQKDTVSKVKKELKTR